MTKSAGSAVDAIAQLMAERQQYESWIAALEAKRASTPSHVYERVHADYRTRLDAVIEKLMGRTQELESTLRGLADRLSKLQSEETRLRDSRFESQLRADVGEITPERWDEVKRSSDDEIVRLGAERAAVTTEIARIQQILSMSGTKARGERPPTPAAGASSTADESASGDRSARDRLGAAFDELAFLKSVADPGAGDRGSRPRADVPERGQEEQPRAAAEPAGRAPSRNDEERRPRRGTPVRPQDSVRGNTSSRDADQLKLSEEAQRASRESGQVPTFLRDVPTEATKTLKCAECDAMNYPTEWYCARCGAELAAM